MEAVCNNLHLSELLSGIKPSWITNVKSDVETVLTSRYIAIIMKVLYSTRTLLTQKCACHQRQVDDKLKYTAMLYFWLALSSYLLLLIDCTWPKHSSVCPYSILPSLTNWCGQASALSDPLLGAPTIFHARLTHCLVKTVSTSETQVSFCRATRCSVIKDWLSLLKLFLFTFFRNIASTILPNINSRSSLVSQERLAASEFCI
jgi:hypothetical protein